MTYPRIRIRTASRLHFGLLGWGPEARRQFGGIGLMIDSPGIELHGRTGGGLERHGSSGTTGRANCGAAA